MSYLPPTIKRMLLSSNVYYICNVTHDEIKDGRGWLVLAYESPSEPSRYQAEHVAEA